MSVPLVGASNMALERTAGSPPLATAAHCRRSPDSVECGSRKVTSVKLKEQVVIWGPLYRVDVWPRPLLGGRGRKTWWSRVTERQIQEAIERRRAVGAGEPTVPPDAPLRAVPMSVGCQRGLSQKGT